MCLSPHQRKYPSTSADQVEPSRVPRSDSGQKMILWAFYRQGSNFAAPVRPLRASARARDRPGHTILIKYLCPTEPGSAATSPVLRYHAPKNHYTAEFKLQATTRPFCLQKKTGRRQRDTGGAGPASQGDAETQGHQQEPERAAASQPGNWAQKQCISQLGRRIWRRRRWCLERVAACIYVSPR